MRSFFEINTKIKNKLPFFLNSVGYSPTQIKMDRPNGFEYHQFLAVKAGEGIFTVKGERFTLSAGKGVFVRANVPQTYEGSPFHTLWCSFLMSTEALDCICEKDLIIFDTPIDFESELEALLKFANGQSTVISRSAAGYSLVTELFSKILTVSDDPATVARSYLESRYSEPITLDEVANAVGMDKFALCRYYSAERGTSVMEELKSIRIAKAKRLLRYTADSVERIGKQCGFESPSYFCMRFKEACGCTPGEYRKKKSIM